MVSARAAENQLVFAKVQTEAKNNEITAVPMLLEQIGVRRENRAVRSP